MATVIAPSVETLRKKFLDARRGSLIALVALHRALDAEELVRGEVERAMGQDRWSSVASGPLVSPRTVGGLTTDFYAASDRLGLRSGGTYDPFERPGQRWYEDEREVRKLNGKVKR